MFRCSFKITDKINKSILLPAVLMLVMPLYAFSETYTQQLIIESGYGAEEKSGSETVIETIVNPPEQPAAQQNNTQTPAASNVIINNYNYYPPYTGETIYIKAPPYNSYFNIGGYSYRGYNFGLGAGLYYGADGKKYYRTPWTPVHTDPQPLPQDCAKKGSGQKHNKHHGAHHNGASAEVKASVKY